MAQAARSNVNAREFADRANLERLIEEDRGHTRVGRRYLCPFHDDHKPDLAFSRKTNRYQCFGCGAHGDALDWLTKHRKLLFKEALAALGADVGIETPVFVRPIPPPLPERPKIEERPSHLDADWQGVVGRIIQQAKLDLWSDRTAPVRAWMNKRGISDVTARALDLGYIADYWKSDPFDVLRDRDGDPVISLLPGLLFPTIAPGSTFGLGGVPGVNQWGGGVIRRLNQDPFDATPFARGGKCMAIKGTDRSELYPFPDIDPSELPATALVVEGEIDAVLGWQDVGYHLIVCTVGGANGKISRRAVEQIAQCRQVLIATDIDAAGSKAYWKWHALLPPSVRSAPALLPRGKDLGEFRQNHQGNVAEWITARLKELGWPLHPEPTPEDFQRRSSCLKLALGTGPGDAYEGDLPENLPRLI